MQAQLDRLAALSLPQGRIGLETIRELLARLGNPQNRSAAGVPCRRHQRQGFDLRLPARHAGGAGLSVHVATKPHLVRYNERIRVAGELISDAMLASLLEEVLDVAGDLSPSFFEVTTAATFLAFAAHLPMPA